MTPFGLLIAALLLFAVGFLVESPVLLVFSALVVIAATVAAYWNEDWET